MSGFSKSFLQTKLEDKEALLAQWEFDYALEKSEGVPFEDLRDDLESIIDLRLEIKDDKFEIESL